MFILVKNPKFYEFSEPSVMSYNSSFLDTCANSSIIVTHSREKKNLDGNLYFYQKGAPRVPKPNHYAMPLNSNKIFKGHITVSILFFFLFKGRGMGRSRTAIQQ